MIEVILLVIIFLILVIWFFFYGNSIESRIIIEKERLLKLQEKKLIIAQKKFMKGKINQPVFEELKNDLKFNSLLLELEILRLKQIHQIEIEEKVLELISKLKTPTKYRKTKLRHLLIESEILMKEINLIEKKMMKNEISQELFKKIIKHKENELIEKEAQIVDFINQEEE